jgi:hypothetical protein
MTSARAAFSSGHFLQRVPDRVERFFGF